MDIINLAFETGVFPEELKEVVIRLLFKKTTLDPAESDPGNYLPFSNLMFLGKVIEKVAAKQLQEFLDNTSVLDPFQSSFHPKPWDRDDTSCPQRPSS